MNAIMMCPIFPELCGVIFSVPFCGGPRTPDRHLLPIKFDTQNVVVVTVGSLAAVR